MNVLGAVIFRDSSIHYRSGWKLKVLLGRHEDGPIYWQEVYPSKDAAVAAHRNFLEEQLQYFKGEEQAA